MPLKRALASQHLMTNYGLRQNHRKIIGKTKKSAFCVPYSVVQQKCNSSKYLSAFLQAIRHQSRHPG
jgi:hypothetical protein